MTAAAYARIRKVIARCRGWCLEGTSPYTLRAAVIATVAVVLFYINAVISARDVGLGVYDYMDKNRMAVAIEKIPDRRRHTINNAFYQGKISGYRQQLELQILEDIKPETSALASRIRSISSEQWKRMWSEQAFQLFSSKIGGALLASTGGTMGNAQDLNDLWSLAENIIQSGYSAKSFNDALAGTRRKLNPNLNEKQRLLALKIQHILDQSLKAHQHELMAARFRLVILGLKKSYCTESSKDYEEKLKRQATYYAAKWNLTQGAGSRDSIWKDWPDFEAWLHERVLEQAGPECKKKEEPPKGLKLVEKDCPIDVGDVRLVLERAGTMAVGRGSDRGDVLRCLYYKVFPDTGKQKPGISHLIGDTMATLVRLKDRESALGKFPWAMKTVRQNLEKAIAKVTARTMEEKPSRDMFIVTAEVSDALPGRLMYVKLAAFRYKNCIILIHTHRDDDEDWLKDILKILRIKFEKLVDRKG